MKYIIYIVLFIWFAPNAKGQDLLPKGVPTQKINGWIENWYTIPDSGSVISKRDTNWRPRFVGMTVTWPHAGVDTVQWFWDGGRWNRNGAMANNGLSNSGSIQLGQSVGASGNPAILINDREIPTAGFNTFFSGTGGVGIGATSLVSGNKLQVAGNAGFSSVRIGSLTTFTDAPISAGTISDIPFMSFYDPFASIDEKIWDFQAMGRNFNFNVWNDAVNASVTVMTVRRAGANVESVAFPNGFWQYGGGTPIASFSIFAQDAMRLPVGSTAQRPTGHEGFFRVNTDSANAPEYFDGSNWVRLAASIGNPLTSVGLSMPSAFSVSGSPLTSNGAINVTGAGTTAQYVRGNGTLATTDTGMIPNFYLKVRGLLSATSPITYNSITGAIGVLNADATGTKGAATFNNVSFSDNSAGLISLNQPVSPGACTNCNITWGVDGRPTAYSTGTGGNGVDTIYRTPGIDSIYFKINGIQRAIKDSVSSSGGGGGVSDTLIESSAGTLTLAQRGDYIFNGTTTTWTLPALGSNLRTVYYIKNAGSGDITLNRAGSDNIYSTSSVTSVTIGAGTNIRLVGGITFWYVEL